MTAAINSVADAMHNELSLLMQKSYFSLILDEATAMAVRGEVGMSVRVCDIESGKIQSMMFGVEEVNSPTMEQIFSVVAHWLQQDITPWKNLIAFTSDGANVMRSKRTLYLRDCCERSLICFRCTVYVTSCTCLHLKCSKSFQAPFKIFTVGAYFFTKAQNDLLF
jgi:hypothetical protein